MHLARSIVLAVALCGGATLPAPRAAAQSLAARYAFTPLDGVPRTAGLQTVRSGARHVVVVGEGAEVLRLSTRFTRGTSVSGFRYGTNGEAEWLSFQARDARYVTDYRWFFASGLLTYAATGRRTNRIWRGTQNVRG